MLLLMAPPPPIGWRGAEEDAAAEAVPRAVQEEANAIESSTKVMGVLKQKVWLCLELLTAADMLQVRGGSGQCGTPHPRRHSTAITTDTIGDTTDTGHTGLTKPSAPDVRLCTIST